MGFEGLQAYITGYLLKNLYLVSWIAGLLLIVFGMINLIVARRMSRRLRQFFKAFSGASMDDALLGMEQRIQSLADAQSDLRHRVSDVVNQQSQVFYRMGLIRFNAFQDTGGDLSFAIALLNRHGDGLVLSSISGRNETRLYAKPIQNLQSSYALSQEEQRAIQEACHDEERGSRGLSNAGLLAAAAQEKPKG